LNSDQQNDIWKNNNEHNDALNNVTHQNDALNNATKMTLIPTLQTHPGTQHNIILSVVLLNVIMLSGVASK
jgi:hypothetical protein